MTETGPRGLTLTTIAFLVAYFGFIITVSLGQAGTVGGMVSVGVGNNSNNDENDGSDSSSGSRSGKRARAQTGLRKSGSIAVEGTDNMSFCYNLDLTNRNNTPVSFDMAYSLFIGPFPDANMVTASLHVDLFDADDSGTASLTATGPGGTFQSSSIAPGSNPHGVNLGSSISTPGEHVFQAGPIAGPTTLSSTGFLLGFLQFVLSPKDRVHIEGFMRQDDGVDSLACKIPLTSEGFNLTKDMQKCANDTGKALAKSVTTGLKELCKCIKALVKNPGSAPDIADCLDMDAKGKLAKADAAALKKYTKKCVGENKAGIDKMPPFGAADPNDPDVFDAVRDTPLFLAIHAFSQSVDAPLLSLAGDKNGTKCQQAFIKDLKKCLETRLKEYASCKKKALKAGVGQEEALAACIGADPKGKIAKACDDPLKPDKLRKILAKKCVAKGVSLATAFPGRGVDGDVDATHAAILDGVPCLACMLIQHLDALHGIDCDPIDDGLVNGSCTVW